MYCPIFLHARICHQLWIHKVRILTKKNEIHLPVCLLGPLLVKQPFKMRRFCCSVQVLHVKRAPMCIMWDVHYNGGSRVCIVSNTTGILDDSHFKHVLTNAVCAITIEMGIDNVTVFCAFFFLQNSMFSQYVIIIQKRIYHRHVDVCMI